ncbi:hypothetical protein ElyMa_005167200 [Elysia marginata]|uniref:Uncharacterized protein n=1 Tax=Elysia marginata TaxID=1093978 RepID=A0AAV4JPY8_9GAST|nr:hypothetical protein ElyMa_005167200 [Elysia marginata]
MFKVYLVYKGIRLHLKQQSRQNVKRDRLGAADLPQFTLQLCQTRRKYSGIPISQEWWEVRGGDGECACFSNHHQLLAVASPQGQIERRNITKNAKFVFRIT